MAEALEHDTPTQAQVDALISDAPKHAPPPHVEPMLARLGELPADGQSWGYELKWDGIRAIAHVVGGAVRLETRNLVDVSAQYPEFASLARALEGHEVVLDGEIVALDERGLPSFQRLQRRLGLKSPDTIRARSRTTPVMYAIFDVLHLDGHDLTSLPLVDRRAILTSIEGLQSAGAWRVTDLHDGGGRELLAAVVDRGMEGIVAKRLDSPYALGRRNSNWIKIKQQARQEFIIAGFTEGAGSRSGSIGALLLGVHDVDAATAQHRGDPQLLEFVGGVGTGFSQAELKRILALLEPLEIDQTPFDVRSPDSAEPRGKWQAIRARGGGAPAPVHFVEPRLVCEVEFTEFTRDGTLRHPSYQGLRVDKDPADVVREDRPA